jgi:hypothetical protein
VANLPIEDRLLHYFLAMGAQQTERAEIPQNNLAFLSGSEKIQVVILRNEDFIQRNRVIETILSLTSLRNTSQLLYLAAPRLLGASIDAAIFKPYGIGLLLFDERRIDEAVPPQSLQPTQTMQQKSPNLDPGVLTELATLRSMYAEMERDMATLREDIKTFQRDSESRASTTEPTPPSRISRPESMFANPSLSGAQFPSFFANNPWLDVLSKRGRPGDEPIAG